MFQLKPTLTGTNRLKKEAKENTSQKFGFANASLCIQLCSNYILILIFFQESFFCEIVLFSEEIRVCYEQLGFYFYKNTHKMLGLD
jgi:hypothetical protein